LQLIQKSSPSSDHVDYLEAIKSVKDYDIIYIFGSGLNDIGLMNFNDELFKINIDNPENILMGVHGETYVKGNIYWYGFGNVTSKQIAPQQDVKSKYQNLYNLIFNNKIYFSNKDVQSSDESNYGNTKVNLIDVSIINSDYPMPKPGTLSSEDIRFKADLTDIIDEISAINKLNEKVIKPYNDYFKNTNGKKLKIKLKGYCSNCTAGTQLAQDRADKIKQLLIQNGIDEECIITENHSGEQLDNTPEWRKTDFEWI
jgi:outer membrane protein OmpA-like peptidoglycan-associated protein